MVVQHRMEAVAIARLLGDDRTRIAGYVYFWNTFELTVLWIDESCVARFIEPPLQPEVLEKARSVTPADFIDFLMELSSDDGEGPKQGRLTDLQTGHSKI